jgi:hypothetical protein
VSLALGLQNRPIARQAVVTMSFLIAVFPNAVDSRRFDDALELHQSGLAQNSGRLVVNVATKSYRIVCLTYENGYASKMWREDSSAASGSFVYILGWCYRIGSLGDWPNDRECQEMLHRQRNGLSPLDENYSGNYGVVVYDSEHEEIALQPDHWAMSGVYYSASPKCIAVSNRSTAVASLVFTSLDGYSILSLLRGTHFPFGRTLFSDVHRVMCGCYLKIDISRMQLNVTRAFPIYVPAEKKSFTEAKEAIGETLCRMAQRWSGSQSAIFDLTGGNDTRLTAAAMLHENPEGLQQNLAWCVTGPEDHPDVRIATKIADLCKWPLLRLDKEVASDASIEWLQKAILAADGTCLVDSACARIKQELNRGDWTWHVGSIGGELLRGFFWRHEFLSLGKTNRVDCAALLAYRLYASRQVDTKILGEHSPSLSEHDEILLGPYRRIGEIGNDALNPYKLDTMYMHKLCYSAGNGQSWLMGLRNIQLPLVSWELSKEILSIPWKLRATRRLILTIIGDLAPQLATIPNDRGEPMRPITVGTLPFYVKCGALAGVRTLPRVINRYTGLEATGQVTNNHVPASRIPVVLDAKHLHSIFDSSVIKEICFKIGSGDQSGNLSRIFQTMLTLELLLRAIPNICARIRFDTGPAILQ